MGVGAGEQGVEVLKSGLDDERLSVRGAFLFHFDREVPGREKAFRFAFIDRRVDGPAAAADSAGHGQHVGPFFGQVAGHFEPNGAGTVVVEGEFILDLQTTAEQACDEQRSQSFEQSH